MCNTAWEFSFYYTLNCKVNLAGIRVKAVKRRNMKQIAHAEECGVKHRDNVADILPWEPWFMSTRVESGNALRGLPVDLIFSPFWSWRCNINNSGKDKESQNLYHMIGRNDNIHPSEEKNQGWQYLCLLFMATCRMKSHINSFHFYPAASREAMLWSMGPSDSVM